MKSQFENKVPPYEEEIDTKSQRFFGLQYENERPGRNVEKREEPRRGKNQSQKQPVPYYQED